MTRLAPFLLLCFVVEIASAQSEFLPGTRRTTAFGTTTKATVVGDFNRDGNPDLAVTLHDVDSLGVRLGDGRGNFGALARYRTAGHPTAVAAGDLNGDGIPELVTANSNTANVSLFRGLAGGIFGGKIDFPTGLNPAGITIGDASGDGKPDVVVACTGSNAVTVLVGGEPGPGLTGASFNVTTGAGPSGVALADLNEDGLNDIVTANQNAPSLSVLRRLPAGGFAAKVDYATAQAANAVALGDLDGDGAIDAVAADRLANRVSILLGNGSGGFGADNGFPAGSLPAAIALADVTGDAFPDVVLGNSNVTYVTVLAGDGLGGFTLANVQTIESSSAGLSVADIDLDGHRDLVFVGAGNAMVMSGNGGGIFGAETSFGAGLNPQSLAVGDLNGDLYPDLVAGNYQDANASVLLNAGDGTFHPRVDYPTTGYPAAVALGDAGADGNREIFVSTGSPFVSDANRFAVLPNLGAGAFGPKVEFAVAMEQYFGIAVGELNGDGKLDVVISKNTAGAVQPYFGNGLGSFAVQPQLLAGSGPTMVRLVDVNANGKLDLIVANSAATTVTVFKGDGLGGFGAAQPYGTGTNPVALDTGDLDGDGDVDIAVTNKVGLSISLLLNDGSGNFAAGTALTSTLGQPAGAGVGDVNQDGRPEVFYVLDDDLVTRLGTGAATFSSAILQPLGGSGAVALALGDLDRNGTLDAVTANAASNNLSVLFGLARTRTALAVTPQSTPLNASMTFTATVTPAAPDGSDPTGMVRFYDGVTPYGFAKIENGVASVTLPASAPWERSIQAEYMGDHRFYPSFSPVVPHVTFLPPVGVEPAGPAGALAIALARNPVVDGRLRVRLSLPTEQPAEVSVIDVRGRVVARAAVGPGEHALARGLAPGVYHVRLVQGSRVAVARAVVL